MADNAANAQANQVPPPQQQPGNLDANVAALTATVQQLINELALERQARAAAEAAGAPAAGAPAAAVPFHLSPAQRDLDAVMDLQQRAGISIFEHSQKGDPMKYDLKKEGLSSFKQRMKDGAKLFGCDRGPNSVIHFDGMNVLEQYGKLDIDRLRTLSEPFITGDKKDTRQGQNNDLFVQYMLKSLTADAYKSVMVYEKDFSIERDGERIHVVPLLWKRIVAYPSLQTKRTTTNLRDYLRGLPSQINVLGVEKFNELFKEGMEELMSRGKSIDEPERICFDALQHTVDDRFNKKFIDMEDDIDNDFGPYKDFDWEQICSKASELYTRYKDTWGTKSELEQQFVAFKAELAKKDAENESLRGQLALTKKAPSKGSADKKSKGKSSPSSASKAAPASATKSKNKKVTTDRKRQKKDEAWKKVPPKSGEPHSKVVDDWQCHWCIHHMAWCGHSSNDCELGKRRIQEQKSSFKAASANTTSDPAVQRQNDYMARLAGMSNTGLQTIYE